MLATQPPTENTLRTRLAVLSLTHATLRPLFVGHAQADILGALPAWLWSLPTDQIVNLLNRSPAGLAEGLADALDAETNRRHPADRYVAHLERHSPHLSAVQRARLAEFTAALAEVRGRLGAADTFEMKRYGFDPLECERLKHPANALIEAMAAADPAPEHPSPAPLSPDKRLIEAGNRAHARRAFADGSIDADPCTALHPPKPFCFEDAKARNAEARQRLAEMIEDAR